MATLATLAHLQAKLTLDGPVFLEGSPGPHTAYVYDEQPEAASFVVKGVSIAV